MSKKTFKAIMPLFLVLFSLSGSLTTPRVTASPASILLAPLDGVVGETLVVYGTIDSPDSDFTVRWNQMLNFTGKAVGNNATILFVIPPTVGAPRPAGRNVTVELIDESLDIVVASANFTLFSKFDIQVETPPLPRQLQQGTTVRLNATVTGGEPNTVYKANVTVRNAADQTHWFLASLSNTSTSGMGSAAFTYPKNFTTGANMNYTGPYRALFNETLATEESFFVGLTNKTEYRRGENVPVQAAGYKSLETVKADLRFGGSSVAGFPKNFTAGSSGLATLSWLVPSNATGGTYQITLSNATSSGTVKSPSDVQNFNVTGIICFVQARNLADETVEGVLVEVYNASAATAALSKGNANSTGWVRFNLDKGNYTFKAFFKNAQVGVIANESLVADKQLHIQLSLGNLLAAVRTQDNEGVPLIGIALGLNYTTRENKTATDTAALKTNATGMATARNLFAGKTYRVEATRYGLLFNDTTVALSSSAPGLTILNLTLPNHTLNINAKNSKGIEAHGVDLKVYEWASGVSIPVGSASTDSGGNASFSLPFGRYTLRAFKGADLLSETVVDLVESSTFTLDLVTLDLDVSVYVLDYLGQPLPNAEVMIERKFGQDFVLISTQFTDGAGSAQFAGIVGGNSRVLIYLGGKLVAVQTQFLGSGSNDVVLKVAEVVAVLGYPVSSGAFALLVFVLVLIVVVLVAARRRIMQVFRKPSKR